MAVTQGTKNATADAPMGRRARKALAVRQALFEAGLTAFERQPINLVSVLDITEAADVAKGVFYLQFRSKDDYLLSLWQEVQGRFLDVVREAIADCREQSARIDIITREFMAFVRREPAAARFWIRMSAYFPDEIGEPGHLTRIRQEYYKQLASLITAKTTSRLGARDVRAATMVDSLCWAVINTSVQHGSSPVDIQLLVNAVHAALPAFHCSSKLDVMPGRAP